MAIKIKIDFHRKRSLKIFQIAMPHALDWTIVSTIIAELYYRNDIANGFFYFTACLDLVGLRIAVISNNIDVRISDYFEVIFPKLFERLKLKKLPILREYFCLVPRGSAFLYYILFRSCNDAHEAFMCLKFLLIRGFLNDH